MSKLELTARGKQIRRDALKLGIPNGIYHWGGSFSVVEILIALYDHRVGPDDRVIVSKGHSWIPQVVILQEQGYFPGFGPRLDNPEQNCLVGHPFLDPKNRIWATTGSLGHGLPLGAGMAWAKKLAHREGQVYVVMGDGECQEGTFWETLLVAARQRLSNLTVIVDQNGIQGSGRCRDILPLPPLSQIGKACGWATAVCNGHSLGELNQNLTDLRDQERPILIAAQTVKGAGVSFMENDPAWHAKYPTEGELDQAYRELQ